MWTASNQHYWTHPLSLLLPSGPTQIRPTLAHRYGVIPHIELGEPPRGREGHRELARRGRGTKVCVSRGGYWDREDGYCGKTGRLFGEKCGEKENVPGASTPAPMLSGLACGGAGVAVAALNAT
jgi:hypothetical protein